MTREAACHCGQLRLEVTGEPQTVSICNCLACQRRTGSAFGVRPASAPIRCYNVACCESLAGRTEAAIDHLRHAIGMGEFAAEMAKQDSDFDPIRDQPAFQDLVGS